MAVDLPFFLVISSSIVLRSDFLLSVLDLLALRTAKGDVIYAHCIHIITQRQDYSLGAETETAKDRQRRLKKQKIREWIAERPERKKL